MKTKLKTAVLCLLMAVLIAGCGKEKFCFQAKVLEFDGTTILVEPVEGSDELRSADRFTVSAEGITEEIAVGDTVAITYNGDIMETYPAMLGEVEKIVKVTK